MKTTRCMLLIVLLPSIGYAGQRPQFVLEIVKTTQTELASSYYTPGTPSQSHTSCNGTSVNSGSTGTLDADCTTTTSPGTPARSGTRYSYSEDMRVIMPDGSHLMLWCRAGYRTCLHLAAGRYTAERDKDTVWIFCTFADQDSWNETGMSPGQRKANHVVERIKYRVVGTWKDESRTAKPLDPEEPKIPPKGLDASLLTWSNLADDTFVAGTSFDTPRRAIQDSEVRCGEVSFGVALICKANDTSVIAGFAATRPPQEVYHYWLERISDDFIELKRVSALNCKESCADVAQFITDSEKAYHKNGSVWMKLEAAYCKEVPSGTYPDIDGQKKYCED